MMIYTDAIQSELAGNEALLWSGQPERNVIFHKEDFIGIPFSLMWGGFTLYWEALVLGFGRFDSKYHAPWFFVLWGIPFVVIGQYMIWGRFVYAYWKKARIFYAVTSRRVFICDVKRNGKAVSSLDLMNISVIGKSVRFSGIGTLTFGSPQFDTFGLPFGGRRNTSLFGSFQKTGVFAFMDIADAEMVYKIIMEAKESTAGQAASPGFGFSRRD